VRSRDLATAPRRAHRVREPGGGPWTLAWFTRVARSLASAPSGRGLLVERTLGPAGGPPELYASDPGIELLLTASARGLPVALDAVVSPPRAPPRIERPGELWFGTLEPIEPRPEVASAPDEVRASAAVPPVSLAVPELPGERPLAPDWGGLTSGVQVHWFPNGDRRLRMRVRALVSASDPNEAAAARAALEVDLIERAARVGLGAAAVSWRPASRRLRRAWARGTLVRPAARAVWTVAPTVAARFAAREAVRPTEAPTPGIAHAAVFGASGSGKSAYLTRLAVAATVAGDGVLVVDPHGDLAPALLAELPPKYRERVVAVDASEDPNGIPGVPLLGGAPAERRDAESAHLIAALKRISVADGGGDVYWGFRLDRIFDSLLRVVHEEGGDLRDLGALLVDPRRREAARLSTRDETARRFLEELPDVLRRNPEFLGPAAARLSRLLATPRLAALVVPRGEPLDLAAVRTNGESVVWRLPIGELGPEGTALATTLLLAHAFLVLARAGATSDSEERRRRIWLVLDEAHLVSPRLLAEAIAEGRKFGLEVVLATQYPDRLAPEVQAAAKGAAGTHVLFRTPWPSAAATGAWAGLARDEAERLLPALPTGTAVRVGSGDAARRELVRVEPRSSVEGREPWEAAVRRTRLRFGASESDDRIGPSESAAERAGESLLLALVGAEVQGGLEPSELVRQAQRASGDGISADALERELDTLVRRRWIASAPEGRLVVTAAGRASLRLGVPSGATREGAEHRALLAEAFRIFARRGYRLELLRQGRFDTPLPDARLRLVPDDVRHATPEALSRALDRARGGWAWKFFGGRDVFVEAEVSGALRPERVRHGVRKAERANAYVLFLASDARRARRIRTALRTIGAGRDRAGVWTLGVGWADPRRPRPTEQTMASRDVRA
jgi:hypothetical protein